MKSLLMMSSLVLALTACSTPPVKQAVGQRSDLAGTVITSNVYQCGDMQVVATATDKEALLLEKNKQSFLLAQVISASGSKYTGDPTAPDLVFWSKGDTALLEEGSQSLDCRQTANLLPLQIRGNEPGWHIAFEQDVTRVNLKYGQVKMTLPPARIEKNGKQWQYTVTDNQETVVAQVENKLCVDTMSGMTYPLKATVTMGEQTMTGCGGLPPLLLSGGEWSVTHVGGAPAQEGVTLKFDTSGQLFGSTGCNRFATTYNLSGEDMRVRPPAYTRMGCAPARMEGEQRLIKLLEGVNAFSIPKAGQLILHGENGQEIKAHRAP